MLPPRLDPRGWLWLALLVLPACPLPDAKLRASGATVTSGGGGTGAGASGAGGASGGHGGAGGGGEGGTGGEALPPPPAHDWSRAFGDGDDQAPAALALDPSGAIVVAGSFEGTLAFGEPALVAGPDEDVFVVKLDASGNHLWSRRFGGAGTQHARGLATSAAGNVAVVGSFSGEMDLEGATLSSRGEDMFVLVLDPDGAVLYSRHFGDVDPDTTEPQRANGAAFDPDGNLFVVGDCGGDVRVDAITASLSDAPHPTACIFALDPQGVFQTGRRLGEERSTADAIAIDTLGNLVVVGSYVGVFSTGGPVADYQDGDGDNVYLLRLFNGALNTQILEGYSDPGVQRARSVAVDSALAVVVGGTFAGSARFGEPLVTGGVGTYLTKLSAGFGAPVHVRSLGAIDAHTHVSVALDTTNDAVVAGALTGDLTVGGAIWPGAGGRDAFFASFDPEGNPRWAGRFGDGADQAFDAVAVDAGGGIVVAGRFSGQLDLGGEVLVGAGGDDVFIARFGNRR